MSETDTKNAPIKLRFGDGETGWGERLSNGTARIMNIPMEQRLNWGDVVKLETDERGWPKAGEIISKQYKNKSAVRYPEPYKENWQKLATALRAAGAMTEGLVGGIGAVAHGAEHDIIAIAKSVGIDVTIDEGEDDD